MSVDDREHAIEYFKVLKEYANNEDSLMNYRMNWCLGISTVMFTSLGLMIPDHCKFDNVFYVVVLFVSIGGMVIAAVSFAGVRAAESSLGHLNELWKDSAASAHLADMPELLGGIRLTGKKKKSKRKWYEKNVFSAFLGLTELLKSVEISADHNFVGRHYPTILISTILLAWLVILVGTAAHLVNPEWLPVGACP